MPISVWFTKPLRTLLKKKFTPDEKISLPDYMIKEHGIS
jgi:hypothetical protein